MANMQSEERFVLNIQLTDEEVGRLARDRNFRESKQTLITLTSCLLIGVVSFFDGLRSVGVVLLMATPAAALYLASPTIQGNRMIRANPAIAEMRIWTFSSDGIEVKGNGQTSVLDWTSIGKMYERSACIHLQVRRSSLRILIPLRVFASPSDANRFMQFVKQRLKN